MTSIYQYLFDSHPVCSVSLSPGRHYVWIPKHVVNEYYNYLCDNRSSRVSLSGGVGVDLTRADRATLQNCSRSRGIV